MRVLYTYHRYFNTRTDEEDSLEEAVGRALMGLEYNEAYPVKIEAIDGSFCYERGEPGKWDGPLDKMMEDHRKRIGL